MSTLTPTDVIRPSLDELLLPTGHPDHPPVYDAKDGLRVDRRNTVAGVSPFESTTWVSKPWQIFDKGTVVAEGTYEVPEAMGSTAVSITASKYARKTLVPQYDLVTGELIRDADGQVVLGRETSLKMTVARIANAFMFWGQSGGYFASAEDAAAFRDEMLYLLIHQKAANNSPVWFNVGIHEAYGIIESASGNVYYDPDLGEVLASPHRYFRAAVNACFITVINDTLVDNAVGSMTEKSIFGNIMDEARLFKDGSGAGANWSMIRAAGEPLTGGGTSSGVISFLKVADVAAGSIKSGGYARRAAKMVVLDVDHPEVREFIGLKVEAERMIPFLEAGGYPVAWNDPKGAYAQVPWQNANHTVSVSHDFMDAVRTDRSIDLTARKAVGEDGNPLVMDTVRARELWDDIAEAAWECADPGLHFNGTMNDWATAPNDGPIRGSNPCSEYLHVDGTACNLASLRLTGWWDPSTGFDIDGFAHASRVYTIGLEIAVHMSHYPSATVAFNSYEHRTLGLGICDIGGLLMRSGIGYDSDEGRAVSGAIQALQTAVAYETSAEMARALGPCKAYERNTAEMQRVLRNHRRAAYGTLAADRAVGDYEGLTVTPVGIDHGVLARTPFASLSPAAVAAGDRMVDAVAEHGARNMQTTVTAPTGTIGMFMEADTTGPEPLYSFVAFKTLAGGGAVKLTDTAVSAGLLYLGYTPQQVRDVEVHIAGTGTLDGDQPVNRRILAAAGVPADVIAAVESGLSNAMDLRSAFGPWLLTGEEAESFATANGITSATGNWLDELGFTTEEIDASSRAICGHHNITHAPHVSDEHKAIFLVADAGGEDGRSLDWQGHVRMLGATAPFLSGAASKTVNLPGDATVDDIRDCHQLAYELGVKAVAVYRDGSKYSQPLSSAGTLKQKPTIVVDGEVKVSTAPQPTEAEAVPVAPAEPVDSYAVVADAIRSGAAPIGHVEELRELLDLGTESVGLSADEFARALDTKDKHALKELLAQLGDIPEGMSPQGFYEGRSPRKFRMPSVRASVTEKFTIGGQDVFLTHGAYPDGTCGEFFLKLSKEGGTTEGLTSMLATVGSMALQRGVPLKEIVDKFVGQRFEPSGIVAGHPNLKMASSILDAVGRILAFRYLNGDGDYEKYVQVQDNPFVTTPTAWQPGLALDGIEAAPKSRAASPAAVPGPSPVSPVAGHESLLDIGDAPDASKMLGGKTCHDCGFDAMFPNGICDVCRHCGSSSGCS
ncbi:Ribonucleotide reductase of class II (coenzyme B12-dependent) (plasmid) [Euzebya pacifica]|uniref:Vitamin B12-dependent ribonucleotide reductase n=1 Tax=Euzebya pacifica TaxID=1608957 RepID=A0A346Y751_9ACTN|nr:vitamin B12-dependent ribonucleotide reductase [Euzebya pacifica]AXV10298.1 Ribonucleotide reductase of class II (coenzyme B12-dependent) [Euzebya pacifica]